MTCTEVIDGMMMYVEGSLTPRRREAAERHLSGCLECQEYLQTYRRTIEYARRTAETAAQGLPESLVRGVLEAREQVEARSGE
jgi:anti-sigma factor RsiW